MKRVAFGVAVLAVLVWAAIGLVMGPWEPHGLPEPPAQEEVDGAGLTGRLQEGNEGPPEVPAAVPPARTEVDAGNVGSLEVTVLVGTRYENEPLPGEPVLLGSPDPLGHAELRPVGITAADGRLVLHGLEVRNWRVAVRDTDPRTELLLAGQTIEVSFLLLPRVGVEGLVVDAQDRPVPDADVWLSEARSTIRGELVGKTDGEGRFSLSSVGQRTCVVAIAAGFAVSTPVPVIAQNDREVVRARIVLDKPGEELRGVVTDMEERPVAGARIAIGEFSDDGVSLRGSLEQWEIRRARVSGPPLELRTDSSGRFHTTSAPTGPTGSLIQVHADAPGFGVTRVRLSLPFQEPLTIRLERGVTAKGTVRSSDGQPLAGIAVRSSASRGGGPGWDEKTVFSSDNGTFEIGGLTPGSMSLGIDDGTWGAAETEITAGPGETFLWDPVLDPGHILYGRVVDEEGRPRGGWSVLAFGPPSAPMSSKAGRTDAQGRFRFLQCADGPYSVVVTDREADRNQRMELGGGYFPGMEHVLVVPESARPTAFVQGSLADPEGRPVAARVDPDPGSGFQFVKGDFVIGPFFAGKYRFLFSPEELPPIRTGEVQLVASRTVSLGTLVFQPHGSLEVSAVDDFGQPVSGELTVRACLENSIDQQGAEEHSGVYLFDEIPPGRYTVTVTSEDHAMAVETVEVVPGVRSSTVIRLTEGHSRTFVFDERHLRSGFGAASVHWQDGEGRLLYWELLPYDPRGNEPIRIERVFSPGAYRLSLRVLPHIVDAEVEFQVDPDNPAPDPIVVR